MAQVIGRGTLHGALNRDEVQDICAHAVATLAIDGKRVLVLIPDHTRRAPIHLFFRVLCELLQPRVLALDYLVATGTHVPMAPERLYRHVGLAPSEHRDKYPKVQFFNHNHLLDQELATLGVLPSRIIAEATNGLCSDDLKVSINRKALEYDHILIVSPVVPHEAMGFAGGNKYLFPGIAGLELIESFHWLAAIITNPVINGVKDTPTRRIIDQAAKLLPTPRTCFAFAVNSEHEVACLYAGEPEAAWSQAADISSQLHIRYLTRPYKRVLALTPHIYEELWVAGKAMYKLESIVADGGELIIHGPHILDLSFVHGHHIRHVGYHVRDYFTKRWDRFAHHPRLVLAHCSNVKGVGSFDDGVERPRIEVTLATGISEDICRAVNLGYLDPKSITLEQFEMDEDTLVVREAGQTLYRCAGT